MVLSLALCWLTLVAGCDAVTSTPPMRTAGVDAVRVNHRAPAPALESSQATSRVIEPPTGVARVVLDETHFHFGQMDPLAVGERAFVVHNGGTAPLVFGVNRSTCKCTISRTSPEPVPPGGSTSILVTWQTGPKQAHFHESATIATNDPACPELKLSIEGNVLVHVTASPSELELPDIGPDETPVASTIIGSQVWEHFTIDQFASSLEGIRWEATPVDPAELQRMQCRGGYRLQLTLPDGLPQGDFTHWIRFRVDPQTPDQEAKHCELALRGRVLRRLAVYGPGVDQTATVRMGIIDSSQPHRHRLLLKVRDAETQLVLRQVEAEPKFVGVSLTPLSGEAGRKGLYHLDIEVPADATAGRHQGAQAGKLRLQFDHPRISELVLRLDFAVASRFAAQSSPPSFRQDPDR